MEAYASDRPNLMADVEYTIWGPSSWPPLDNAMVGPPICVMVLVQSEVYIIVYKYIIFLCHDGIFSVHLHPRKNKDINHRLILFN